MTGAQFSPSLRRGVLVVHLSCSVGWIGAVLVYLALVIATTSSDPLMVRSAWIGMDLTGWWVLAPLAAGTVLSGVALSLGTPWGLFRHYWVVTSLILTLLCTAVMLLHLASISRAAAVARVANDAALTQLGSDFLHPTAGLALLFVIMILNVYKPRGLTLYGWRRQQEQRSAGYTLD